MNRSQGKRKNKPIQIQIRQIQPKLPRTSGVARTRPSMASIVFRSAGMDAVCVDAGAVRCLFYGINCPRVINYAVPGRVDLTIRQADGIIHRPDSTAATLNVGSRRMDPLDGRDRLPRCTIACSSLLDANLDSFRHSHP